MGRLTETLKWGQPSYLTEETGSGTTVRIDRLKAADGYAVYFHCQSGLLGQFRELYPDTFTFEGKRAIKVFAAGDRVPAREIAHCLGARPHPSLQKEETEIVTTVVYSARRILTTNPEPSFGNARRCA